MKDNKLPSTTYVMEITKDGMKPLDVGKEIEKITTKPSYYQFSMKGISFDVFDLVEAIEDKQKFSFQLANALKYIIRNKENKKLDLEKAIECLKRELNKY